MQQVITALQACIPKRRPHAPAGGSPAAAAESAPPPGPKTARSRNQTQTVGSNRAGTATPACATYCEGCGSAQCSGRPHRPTHSPSRSVPLATAPAIRVFCAQIDCIWTIGGLKAGAKAGATKEKRRGSGYATAGQRWGYGDETPGSGFAMMGQLRGDGGKKVRQWICNGGATAG
eukprot:362006-Chlamydomonas_euryale.AAC.1